MSKLETNTNDRILSDLYGSTIEVDLSQKPRDRITHFLEKINNPNLIQGKDYQIEMAWHDTEQTIQDCITELITLI